jgi:hypothetical protein
MGIASIIKWRCLKINKEKNAFILEWEAYGYNILSIGRRYGKTIEWSSCIYQGIGTTTW